MSYVWEVKSCPEKLVLSWELEKYKLRYMLFLCVGRTNGMFCDDMLLFLHMLFKFCRYDHWIQD